MIESEKVLLEFIIGAHVDAIVVEGYDGVGKGRVLNILSEVLGVVPYRPDYNLWQNYDHRPQDRWKVSGFFWDVFSHFYKFNLPLAVPMLFDRGVISGAVYNNDASIAENYKKLLGNREVLHILVTCDEEDYYKFAEVRGVTETPSYEEYKKYTESYIKNFEIAGVTYTVYNNKFDESLAESMKYKCEGCGHYSYGYCMHPMNHCKVDKEKPTCPFSEDKEVQDATEMQCV